MCILILIQKFTYTKKNISMSKKTALIFGVTGQDGSYLSEFLIKKGYTVHGVKRRSSSLNTNRVDHIYQDPFEKKKIFFCIMAM